MKWLRLSHVVWSASFPFFPSENTFLRVKEGFQSCDWAILHFTRKHIKYNTQSCLTWIHTGERVSRLQDVSKSSDESSSAKCQNAPEHLPSVLIDLLTADWESCAQFIIVLFMKLTDICLWTFPFHLEVKVCVKTSRLTQHNSVKCTLWIIRIIALNLITSYEHPWGA